MEELIETAITACSAKPWVPELVNTAFSDAVGMQNFREDLSAVMTAPLANTVPPDVDLTPESWDVEFVFEPQLLTAVIPTPAYMPYYMHKLAFIVRGCDDETAQMAAEYLLSSVIHLEIAGFRLAQETVGNAEIFTTAFEGGRPLIERLDPVDNTWTSVFDPYYSTLHNCNRGIGMDTDTNLQTADVREYPDLPAMRRVACVLNYMCMFSGIIQTPVTVLALRLTSVPVQLHELMASGNAQVSLRPYVVHQVTGLPITSAYFPWFGTENCVQTVALGGERPVVRLGMNHPVLCLNVSLRLLEELIPGQRMPVVTNIKFRANDDDAITFVRDGEQLLHWGSSEQSGSVMMPITDTPIWDKVRLFEDMFIHRKSINFSRLDSVVLTVDIENPDMLPCEIHITSFATNVLVRKNETCRLLYSN